VATKPSSQAEDLARSHRSRQQLIAARAVGETRRLWRFGTWSAVSTRALSTVRSALLEAARGAQLYVAAAARAWGVEPDPYGIVAEHTFGNTASDGRPLNTLLDYPAFEVEAFVSQGMQHDHAQAVGERHLERIVATQVADAARISTGVAVANDRAIKGYVRHLTLPSCSRCIILAGQWYRWSAGFKRHPQCDCVHIPAAVSAEPTSPREVYYSLTDEERRKAGWSGHDQRAIEDGADLAQATNYRRALKSVSVAGRPIQATRVGTTKRALAGKRLGRGDVRLTPESIYAEATRLTWTREQTLDELKRHGYIL
jgi:hypothetical protein